MNDLTEVNPGPRRRAGDPVQPAASGRTADGGRAESLRVGFAGVGWIGRNRLDALAAEGAVKIAAVYDPAADAAAKVLDAHPECVRVGSYGDLLDLDLDGIVIATPSALHAEQAIAALRRGRAVFCQKPLGRTGEETRAVIDAAKRSDRLLGVDLSYRHTAAMQAVRELVRVGELGEVYAVEGVFHNAYGPDKPWFYERREAGGGCLLDLGIHLVDLALWCLDFPDVRVATGAVRRHDRAPFAVADQVEDYAAAQLQLGNGAIVQLACSWRVPAGCDARIELTLFGTKGGACFRNVEGSFYEFVAEYLLPDRTRKRLTGPPDAWGGRAAVAWARQLAESPTFDPEVEHVAAVAETLDRIYGK